MEKYLYISYIENPLPRIVRHLNNLVWGIVGRLDLVQGLFIFMPNSNQYVIYKTPLERFSEKYKVNQETGCWEWISGFFKQGSYGKFKMNTKTMLAHRASYILHIGEIPEGKLVCHHCDNKFCVNPSHFFLGTVRDNMIDAQSKGICPIMKHPSLSTYSVGCRCDECKEFSRVYSKEKRERKKLLS